MQVPHRAATLPTGISDEAKAVLVARVRKDVLQLEVRHRDAFSLLLLLLPKYVAAAVLPSAATAAFPFPMLSMDYCCRR